VLLVGRYRWVIRVGFGATDDFESTGNGGYGSYSEGVVLRQAMSTVVSRGMSSRGGPLRGHRVGVGALQAAFYLLVEVFPCETAEKMAY
jgi:hypothetical protein